MSVNYILQLKDNKQNKMIQILKTAFTIFKLQVVLS
jgi:hypothetical protein